MVKLEKKLISESILHFIPLFSVLSAGLYPDFVVNQLTVHEICLQCAEGFLADNQNGQLRMTCPMCNAKTCFCCKKEVRNA